MKPFLLFIAIITSGEYMVLIEGIHLTKFNPYENINPSPQYVTTRE